MKVFSTSILMIILLLFLACGKGQPGGDKTDMVQSQAEMTPEEIEKEKIKAAMNELIDRLKEGDKTVFYENEFSYYKEQTPLSEYMELPRVLDYRYDTLAGVKYDSIVLMGDSAKLWIEMQYESKAGGSIERAYNFKMYNLDGRWKKPYQSDAKAEIEHQELIRAYEEAADKEAREKQSGD